MHKDSIKKHLGKYVKLRPIAVRIGPDNVALPESDDHWMIRKILDGGIEIENVRTTHTFIMGFDHIHHYTTDIHQFQGVDVGFLTLNVLVLIRPQSIHVEPLDFRIR